MSHDKHTDSSIHRELIEFGGAKKLMSLVAGWTDPFPKPIVETVKIEDGRKIRVVRDDLMEFGTKIRAASAVMSQKEYGRHQVIVYVAPRAGWAPISLAKMCSDTGRRLILFCPAAATMSHHQQVAHSMGAEMRFVRIAAMPVLQRMAKKFADEHGYLFFPLGLAVPAAVAGIAKVAEGLKLKNVNEVWCVISTGVLSRGLQVAWPRAQHHVVAVARNIKQGEKGWAQITSHPLDFLRNVPKDEMPPFPSVGNYDAKAWTSIMSNASDNAVFWNVAGNIDILTGAPELPISNRAWGDDSDLKRK